MPSTDPTYHNNAAYYAELAHQEAETFTSGVVYKGNTLFANIPTSGMKHGWMYNVTDDFTTDNRFSEGTGIHCAAGQNIIWNNDIGKWDLAARGGVESFNGRYGAVSPAANDYSAAQISANITIGGTVKTNVGAALDALNDAIPAAQLQADWDQTDNTAKDYIKNKPDVPAAYTSDPEMDGTASAGSSTAYAKGDHVHPSDSTKMTKGTDYVTAGLKNGVTIGTQATAEGYNTEPTGNQSHAEGRQTKATGNYSHAEGYQTQATGTSSHSEGSGAKATGGTSHAEGDTAIASNSCSHAEGNHTQTGADNQHVQGKYNVGKSTTAFEIGNGTGSSARSNAFEVEWDGDTTAAGEITDGGGNVLSDKFDATSYVNRNERYTVASSGWSNSADGNGYYTNTITTVAYNTYAGFEVSNTGSADGVDATSAEKAAFNLVSKAVMPDGTGATSLTLYAKTKPTTTFYIMLKGVYMAKNAASSTKALDITTGCALTVGVGNSTSAFNGGTERTLKWVKNTVKLSASGWSNTVNASGYYNIGTQLATKIFTDNPVPEVTLIGNSSGTASASVLPTAAEQAAYNLIDYFEMADSGLNRNLFVFAKTKPTTDVYLLIEGMSLT